MRDGSKQKNNYVGDDMNAMQAMMDGLSVQWQKERATEQMTLGGVIDRLSSLPQETVISGLGELDSYRGYYCDLAFDPNGKEKTAAQLLKECKAAMGAVFTGYKGGEYQMGKLTPLWVASYGCCGKKLMAINDDGTLQLAEDD